MSATRFSDLPRPVLLLALLFCISFPGELRATEMIGPGAAHFPMAGGVTGVATGDFNGDGGQDLAVGQGDGRVSILLGDRLGGFTDHLDIPLGTGPAIAVVGDFNADGAEDLAVSLFSDDIVAILLGGGTGSFTHRTDLVPGDGPSGLVVADFNADGIQDLAVANAFSGTTSVLLGNGGGDFARLADLAVGPSPGSVAAGDFDADGAADLAVPSDDGKVYILLGDGFGGFTPAHLLPAGPRAYWAVVGSFDSDGNQDLAVSNLFGDSVSVFLGDGRGAFSLAAEVAVGTNPRVIAPGDFNLDGISDLAVSGYDSGTVSVLLGDGLGGFARTDDIDSGGSNPHAVVVGDFNGDAFEDIAVGNQSGRSVAVILGDGLGGFPVADDLRVPGGGKPGSVGIGDFNADGNPDLAVPNWSTNAVNIFLGDASGGFLDGGDIPVGTKPVLVVVGQFDGDGDLDLAVSNHGSDSVSVLLGDGLGGFTRSPDLPVGVQPRSISVGDFNLDGIQDLAVVNTGNNQDPNNDTVSILVGDGSGKFSLADDVVVQDSPESIAAGDFNGDGVPDLVVDNLNSDSVSVLIGDGRGAFTSSHVPMAGTRPLGVGVGDFNGDRIEDVVVALSGSSSVVVLVGDGLGGFAATPEFGIGYFYGTMAVSDLNEDGVEDVAIPGSSAGTIRVLLGDGLGGFTLLPDLRVGFAPAFVSIADAGARGGKILVSSNQRISPTQPEGSLSVRFTQIDRRTDLNGSNRIDGFDVAEIRRLAACGLGDFCYQRHVDVNLDELIDGDDLAQAAGRLGDLVKEVPNLGASIKSPLPSGGPDTVTVQDGGSLADRLTLQVVVDDQDDPVASADFVLDYDPEVLEYVTYLPGSYFSGKGITQLFRVDLRSPGSLGVRMDRLAGLSPRETVGAGPAPLVEIVFRARGAGLTTLDFQGLGQPGPALLDASGGFVHGVTFVGGVMIESSPSGGARGGPIMGISGPLRFGSVPSGSTSRRALILSNAGPEALQVTDIHSPDPQITTFFTEPFKVPPFGALKIDVVFAPAVHGLLSGEIVVSSNDAARPAAGVPWQGTGLACVATPQGDVDSDGVGDACDNCVSAPNASQSDLDADGFGDTCDVCRLVPDPGQGDADGDGFGDACDVCVLDPLDDPDLDGVCESSDTCPGLYNADQSDADGDGYGDACDACPSDPLNDPDLDGICDGSDNCPGLYNADQADLDGDGPGDPCDVCPMDAQNDPDLDGTCEGSDNCSGLYNADQADTDSDGAGDACDSCPSDPLDDADGDGWCEGSDNCPGLYNADQTDTDLDGTGDDCDVCPVDSDPNQEDRNGDGAGDACQPDLAIVAITEDGGTNLEVEVRLVDPQGDLISGTVTVRDATLKVPDLIAAPDCNLPLPPEFLPGVGVAFGEFGHLGQPFLVDGDQSQQCDDSLPDYETALDTCAQAASFSTLLNISSATYPQPVCFRRIDLSARFEHLLLGLDASGLEITATRALEPYQDTMLPAGMDISALVPGRSYELLITATDGLTPQLVETMDFLYQGESTVVFTLQ